MRAIPSILRPVLALTLAAPVLVAAPRPAHAEGGGFAEVAGGVTLPLGDSNWTDLVESSPKLAVKAGTVPHNLGGMVSADWTPYNTDTMGSTFPGGSTNVSAHRFRILANFLFQAPIRKKLIFEGRAGIGLDIAHASYDAHVGALNFSASNTDLGLGFEFGGGMWFDIGSVLLGAEIAVPFATHSHQATASDDITLDYTSYDIDLMFGVRFVSN